MAKKKKTVVEEYEAGDYSFAVKDIAKIDGVSLFQASDVEDAVPNSTGSFSLDMDLSIPCPERGITEIFGDEGCGKTTLALEICGQALEGGKNVLYMDLEESLSRSLMESIRTIKRYVSALDGDEESPFRIARAADGESALEAARRYAQMVPGSIIVIDSVDACVPRAVLAGEVGDAAVGNLAKLMSDAMRKLIKAAGQSNSHLIFINQQRSTITMYGDPNTTSGGKGLKFYAWQRIKLLSPGKAQWIIDSSSKERVGYMMRYTVVKNKVAPHGQDGEVPVHYGKGIYRERELVLLGVKFGVLDLGGRGGKQVLLPKEVPNDLDADVEEFTAFPALKAADRVAFDEKLQRWVRNRLKDYIPYDETPES